MNKKFLIKVEYPHEYRCWKYMISDHIYSGRETLRTSYKDRAKRFDKCKLDSFLTHGMVVDGKYQYFGHDIRVKVEIE